jgi:hypothetical protein
MAGDPPGVDCWTISSTLGVNTMWKWVVKPNVLLEW